MQLKLAEHIEYAKRNLNFKRIGASIDPNNLASKHVLEKLGFKYIGMIWCDATHQDEPYFELIID